MRLLYLLLSIALPLACIGPASSGTGAQLLPPEDVLAPHIQKEWQAVFFEQFRKDPKAVEAVGFFSSGGWSNEGQALFLEQSDKSIRYLYASSGLNASDLERMQTLQLSQSDFDLTKIKSLFPLENIDGVSFDNLNWEIVILKKEIGFTGKSIKIRSVYINTPELAKYPKHELLIKEIRLLNEKALLKLRGKTL
ncbi:MAG: hypothetical protein WCI18_07200 [Pseudomonadota bacterium]